MEQSQAKNQLVPAVGESGRNSPLTPARKLSQADVKRILGAWTAGKSRHTLDAYSRDLADFAAFSGVGDGGSTADPNAAAVAAASALFSRGQTEATLLAIEYRESMRGRGLSPATMNRRIAALRSLVALGNMLGVIEWKLKVPALRAESYRDTAGPGREAVSALLKWLADEAKTPMRLPSDDRRRRRLIRDRAIIRLLFDLALRREEAVSLNMQHLDLNSRPPTVAVMGKGRTERERLTLPVPTAQALKAWLEVRADCDTGEPSSSIAASPAELAKFDAPVFVNYDPARKGLRLTGRSVARVVEQWSAAALDGMKIRPHGFRHTAITAALDDSGGDVRKVREFSRHAKLETLLVYDDNLQDHAGDIAAGLAESV